MFEALTGKLGLEINRDNFEIRAEQLRTLVRAYPAMIAANAVMAPLVVWLMWHKVDHVLLLCWIALLYIFHSLEAHHWLNYPKTIRNIGECKRWQRQFLLSDGLVGSTWGSAGVFMFVPGEPLYQAFLLSIMMGMAAGAVAGNLVFPLSQQLYVLLVISPIMLNMLSQGIYEYYLLASMVGVFLVFVLKIGLDQSKYFELSIRRNFENIEFAAQIARQRDQNQRYLDTTLALMLERDKEGNITMINRAAENLLGYERNALLGRNWFDVCLPQPEGREVVYPAFQQLMANNIKTVGEFENVVLRRDGTRRVIAWHNIVLTDAAGRITGTLSSGMDITERKRAEERQLNSFRQLEEKELSKTRFLAAAGHDLRQPVAAANLFIDALKLTSPTPQQNHLIERLDQSMSTFSGLLERLLNISKFDAGLIKPQITSFNLAELFNWLEQNFAQNALDRKLGFRFFFPAHRSLVVRTDIGLLQSVMMNLVSNAIKFTPKGGILVSARVRGNTVLLQVWDTGIGITEQEQQHIYDEFYQASNPQRDREAGLGLGLSICQRAMALLGSMVTCRSQPGRGSVFELTLPLDPECDKIVAPPTNHCNDEIAGEMQFRDKRVMVLEDDALVSAGLIDLLQGLGAEVRHFHSAEEALKHDGIERTDCFIVDNNLGGKLSGFQFLQRLQQSSSSPISAVILTGDTSSQFISDATDSDWPVLHKPINYAKLASSMGQGCCKRKPTAR